MDVAGVMTNELILREPIMLQHGKAMAALLAPFMRHRWVHVSRRSQQAPVGVLFYFPDGEKLLEEHCRHASVETRFAEVFGGYAGLAENSSRGNIAEPKKKAKTGKAKAATKSSEEMVDD
eukprot:4125599-Amphidinium_carterae.1